MIFIPSNNIPNIGIPSLKKIYFLFILSAVNLCFSVNNDEYIELFHNQSQDLQLFCNISAYPSVNILKWVSENVNSTNENQNPLILQNLSKDKSHDFICEGFDDQNEKLVQINYHVVIGSSPEPPEDLRLLANGSTRLIAEWKFVPDLVYELKLGDEDPFNITKYTPASFFGLQPFTRYNLQVSVYNKFGKTQKNITNCTLPGVPDPKPILTIKSLTSSSLSVDIDPSLEMNSQLDISDKCSDNINSSIYSSLKGEFKGYRGSISSLKSNIYQKNIELTSEQNSISYDDLQKATKYSIKLSFYNGVNTGPFTELEFETLDTLPDPPIFNIQSITDKKALIKWKYDPNSTTKKLRIQSFNCPPDASIPSDRYVLQDDKIDYYSREYQLEIFKSATCFCVRMASINSFGEGSFSNCSEFTTDYENPKPVDLKSVSLTSIKSKTFVDFKWTDSNNNSSLPNDQKTSLKYQVCFIGFPQKPNTMMQDVINNSLFHKMNLDKVHEAEKSPKCIDLSNYNCSCDQTVQEKSVNLPVELFNETEDNIEFTIRPMTNNIREDDFLYGSYAEGQILNLSHIFESKSRPSDHLLNSKTLIIIILVTLVILIVLICFLLVVFRIFCRGYRGYEIAHPLDNNVSDIFFTANGINQNGMKSLKSSPPLKLAESMALYDPISSKDLVNVVNSMHANENAGFQLEFEAIEAASRTDWPANIAKHPDNLEKNRYSNVFPFDHSRVILRNPPNKGFNYINASYVDAFDKPNSYIAAQGPLTSTFDEFWQMVWEQNSRVIVMTSDFVERGRRKCDQYWPDEGKFQTYGNISVKLVSQQDLAFYSIRNFTIKNSKSRKNSKERIIYHYQYTDWRDFDVPISPLPVLKFVKITTQHMGQNTGPIIVHCSAGVGRTGTYICIDSMVRQLIKSQQINIKAFLIHIRQQRMKLVQTETQFAFIYDAIQEYLLCPKHEVSVVDYPNYINELFLSKIETSIVKDQGPCQISGLQHQFLIAQGLMENRRNFDSMNNQNANLNFTQRFFMSGNNKFFNDSNSTNLHGYYTLNEYNLITEQPRTSEAVDEFWRRVWDKNCPLIVVLTQKDTDIFWPTSHADTMVIGSLRIAFCGIGKIGTRILRYEFLLSSNREDYALGCHLWQLLLEEEKTSTTSNHSCEIRTEISSTDMSKSTHITYINKDEPIISSKLSTSNPVSINVKEFGDNLPSEFTEGESRVYLDAELLRLSAELSHVSTIQVTRNEKRSGNNIGASLGSNDTFGSTIIIDDMATGQGGIFCALCFLMNQIKNERKVDVYFVVKMFISQNYSIFKNYTKLQQIYEYIETFLKDPNRFVNSSFEFDKKVSTLNVNCQLPESLQNNAIHTNFSSTLLEVPTTPDLIENSYCSQNFDLLEMKSSKDSFNMRDNSSIGDMDENDDHTSSPLINLNDKK